jgi:O-antigen/teichoic acid export membrane protein
MAGRSYKERAVSGVFWNFLFIILSAPLGYLVRILYDRNIPLVDIGLFYAVLDIMAVLAIIRELGLSVSLIHFIPKFLAQNRKEKVKSAIITVALIQGIVGAAITFLTILFSKQIVVYYLSNKTAIPDIRLAIAVVIIGAISSLIECFSAISIHSILGFQKQKAFASYNIAKMTTVLAVSLLMVYFFKVKSAIVPSIAYLIMPVLMLALYWLFFIKKVFPDFSKIKAKLSKKLTSEILRYAIPLALTSVGTIIMTSIDGICLTYLSGLEQVGIYKNSVVPTSNLLLYLASAISVVLFPMISELWARKKFREISSGIEKTVSYSMVAVLPLSMFMAFFPTVILNILWTSKNLMGANALRILSIAAIFCTLFSIFSNFIRATGDSKTPMKILYAGAAFNLIGNLIVIPKMGMTGAALTTMLGYLLTAVLAYVYVKRKIQIRIEWKKIGMALCASLISVGSIILVKNISENLILKLLISGMAYFGTYLAIIFITRTINIEEIKGMIAKK